MAMSGPRGHHQDDDESQVFSDINITPLTDIFLVLLIIFMVGSTVMVEAGQGGAGAGVKVDLPKGAAHEIAKAPTEFAVAILVDGRTVVEGKVVSLDELRARLTKLMQDDAQAQVILQADASVQHGRVVEVMEVAKQVGVQKLAIATEGGP